MTVELPPRRDLPADVKERMRPEFTGVASRRTHAPLAVAAGVALLVAGGVALTQSGTREAEPGHDRVTAPSSRDVERCRTALNDQSWSSRDMVAFGPRKVLVGEDGRFCELTRSQATVTPPDFQPVPLEAGRITYRSGEIIAGVPPLGARTAKAREVGAGFSRGSSDSIVTPDFFIVRSQAGIPATELVFDDHAFPVPSFTSSPSAVSTDNFESGNPDPWAPVNLLDRCADNAFTGDTMKTEELDGWKPLLTHGLDRRNGLLLAHRDHREWASCVLSETRPNALSPIRTSDAPDSARVVGGYQQESESVIAGRVNRAAKTVQITVAGGTPQVTAEVADGYFIAAVPIVGGALFSFDTLRLVARNAANEVVYEGGIG